MPTVTEIKQLLIEELLNSNGKSKGGLLGNAVKRQFPDVDLKRQFGGFHAFVTHYCSDAIVRAEKTGGDYWYKLLGNSDVAGPTVAVVPSHTVWEAFTNTSIHAVLQVDRRSMKLLVLEEPDKSADMMTLQRMTSDDHHSVARGFVARAPSDLQSQLSKILENEDYWPRWKQIINGYPDRRVYFDWMKWRGDQIAALLRKRLSDLGFDEPEVRELVSQVRAKVKRTPSDRNDHAVQNAETTKSPVLNLANIVRFAVADMPDEELRKLWLPVGVVVDAVIRYNRQD